MTYLQHITSLTAALALAGALPLVPARGQSYDLTPAYTAAVSTDSIYSYDWDGSNLYYGTANAAGHFDGLYEYGSSTPVVAASSGFAGASVVTIGNYVYFNTSDIYAYNPGTGTTADVSSATNFGLYGHNGALYITGSTGYPNHIYETALGSTGAFSGTVKDFGADAGYSGPLAFDGEGDLIYAAGFNDDRILEWKASDVAAALAGTGSLTLSNASVLYDYTSTYGLSEGGATSMLVVGNMLYLTLTNFGAPSDLLQFTLNSDGSLNGGADLAYSSDTDALGELREHDGDIYISDGAGIYKLTETPEPSTWVLLGLGGVGLLLLARRPKRRSLAVLAAFALLIGTVPVLAGPFSPDGDQPGSNGVAASASNIVEWANGYRDFDPGPTDIADPNGAKASYGSPTDAQGPASATVDDPGNGVVSLGDGGSIVLTFKMPIANGPGADLAVFENGFAAAGMSNAYFLELATVAVSSDGVNFFTFPSVSLTQTATQVGAYGTLDPTNLYNLAGSEIAGYGTPFDLSDLAGTPGLNLNDIVAVKITDAIGNINMSLGVGTYTEDDASNSIFGGKYGQTNHVINDPYPTDFTTGGFDLDAVAVLNIVPAPEPPAWMMLTVALVLWTGTQRLNRA